MPSRSMASSSPARTGLVASSCIMAALILGSRHAAALQHAPGNHRFMNFIRAIINAGRAFAPIKRRQDGVVTDAQRAMDLDGAIDCLQHDAGGEEFDCGDVKAGGFGSVSINLPRRLQYQ